MKVELPNFLQSCLWSYDLSKLDGQRDTGLIITQILNYGGEKQVEWMKQNYNLAEIKRVIAHPSRGVWLRPHLRQWLNFFDMVIDPLEFDIAVRDLNPHPVLMGTYFRRKGVMR